MECISEVKIEQTKDLLSLDTQSEISLISLYEQFQCNLKKVLGAIRISKGTFRNFKDSRKKLELHFEANSFDAAAFECWDHLVLSNCYYSAEEEIQLKNFTLKH